MLWWCNVSDFSGVGAPLFPGRRNKFHGDGFSGGVDDIRVVGVMVIWVGVVW